MNFDELIEKIWEYLELIRVHTKPKGSNPDYEAPVTSLASVVVC